MFSEEEQVLSKNVEVNFRLSLMIWCAQCAAIELLSEHLRVDFMEQLEAPRLSLVNVVTQYNLALDFAPLPAAPKALSVLGLRPIALDELQPTAEWREDLTEEMRRGAGAQWFTKALNIRFDGKALGLPVGSIAEVPAG